jgi:hypothetical protein
LAFQAPHVDDMTLVQNGDSFGASGSRLIHTLDVGDKNLKLMFTVLANVARSNVRAVAVESVVHAVIGQILRVTKSIADTFLFGNNYFVLEYYSMILSQSLHISGLTHLPSFLTKPSEQKHPEKQVFLSTGQLLLTFAQLGSHLRL